MEVIKCFAAFIAIPKDILCYTVQPDPTAFDLTCSYILQSDMKETVVNNGGFEKKFPLVSKWSNEWGS